MGKYRAYPEYRDSGVEWLPPIPVKWDVKRGKHLFQEINRRSTDGSETLLSVSEYYGVKPRAEVVDEGDHLSRAESLEGYKRCSSNDLVMNIMLAWKRGLGVSKLNGIVSPAYSVFRFSDKASPDFMHYLLRTNLYTGAFKCKSTGVIDSRLRLYPEAFGAIEIITPSMYEQTQIAAFLDRETAKIDRLIAKQKELIALLREKRQAVISHAVTKGLDPDVPMRDSGVEWLGEIPAHWGVKKAKYLYKEECRFVNEGDGVVTAYRDGEVTLRTNRRVDGYTLAIKELGYQGIRKGDLVVQSMDAFAGAIGVSDSDGKCSPEYIVCTPKSETATCDYHATLLREMARRDYIYVICPSVRERAPRFRFSKFSTVSLLVPPATEQQRIASHIKTEIGKLDKLQSLAGEQIAILQERRTALISAAVTGKIDVREEVSAPRPSVETALAVEILNRCASHCGRTKLQKLLFLAEHHGQVNIGSKYCRQAAGPMDGALLDRVEAELESLAYYKRHDHVDGTYSYLKMEHAGRNAIQPMIPQDNMQKVSHVLGLLADKNAHECEAVATIYGAWNDLIIVGADTSRTAVINEVLNHWHQSKRKIPRHEWLQWHTWVASNLRPIGYGKPTRGSQNRQGSLLDCY